MRMTQKMSFNFDPEYSVEETMRELLTHLLRGFFHSPKKFLHMYLFLQDTQKVELVKALTKLKVLPDYWGRKKKAVPGYEVYSAADLQMKRVLSDGQISSLKGIYL